MTSPPPTGTPSGNIPDRLYVLIDGLDELTAWHLAQASVRLAQGSAPKMSGWSAQRLRAYYGAGFFGIQWLDPYVWFQEAGTKPRVMKNLEGKTVPMWIDDPTGTERVKNPRAQTRITASGKQQVLIFRKVAKVGERKSVKRKVAGSYRLVDVPKSYPGAPGRITRRQFVTYPGDLSGKIAVKNIGVRWYNPGIAGKGFMQHAIWTTSQQAGYGTPEILKA